MLILLSAYAESSLSQKEPSSAEDDEEAICQGSKVSNARPGIHRPIVNGHQLCTPSPQLYRSTLNLPEVGQALSKNQT